MVRTTGKIFAIIALLILAWFLGFVFSGKIILPQTLHVGPIIVHYYGIIMALAVLAGFYLAVKRAPQYNIKPKEAEDLIFWLIVGGFIGARLYHVLTSIQYYSHHLMDIFKVWNGGLSIYGAVFGGLAVLWGSKKFSTLHSPLFTILDWVSPSLLLGQIIGRFGNLFNYEAFGYPTNLPWKMFVPVQFRPPQFLGSNFFHPLFLYEAIGNLIILIVILRLYKFYSRVSPSVAASEATLDAPPLKNIMPAGVLFFSYVLLYNIVRFFLEMQRTDSTFIGQFRVNALVSLGLIFVAVVFLISIRHGKDVTS